MLAFVLWFHVATEKVYEKRFPAKIQAIGLSPKLEIEKVDPGTAEIAIIASGKQLLQLALSGGVIAYFDFSLVTRPGEYEYDLGLSDLHDIDISEYRSVTLISGNHFRIAVKPRA